MKPKRTPYPYTSTCEAAGHKRHHACSTTCATCVGQAASRKRHIHGNRYSKHTAPASASPRYPYTPACAKNGHTAYSGGRVCRTCYALERERELAKAETVELAQIAGDQPQPTFPPYTEKCRRKAHKKCADGTCMTCLIKRAKKKMEKPMVAQPKATQTQPQQPTQATLRETLPAKSATQEMPDQISLTRESLLHEARIALEQILLGERRRGAFPLTLAYIEDLVTAMREQR
jgi:hypothetical protein